MPADNVEVVRESFRRWEEGDFEGLGALWREDCRITSPEGWPEPGLFVGRAAVLEQFRRLPADFEQSKLEIKAVEEQDDWAIVDYDWRARGAGSGLENRMPMAAAFRLEEGRYREGHFRWTRAEALEAAGLSNEELLG